MFCTLKTKWESMNFIYMYVDMYVAHMFVNIIIL